MSAWLVQRRGIRDVNRAASFIDSQGIAGKKRQIGRIVGRQGQSQLTVECQYRLFVGNPRGRGALGWPLRVYCGSHASRTKTSESERQTMPVPEFGSLHFPTQSVVRIYAPGPTLTQGPEEQERCRLGFPIWRSCGP